MCDVTFSEYTEMTMSQVTQQQSVSFTGSLSVLKFLLSHLAGCLEQIDDKKIRVYKAIDISIENKMAVLEVNYCVQNVVENWVRYILSIR